MITFVLCIFYIWYCLLQKTYLFDIKPVQGWLNLMLGAAYTRCLFSGYQHCGLINIRETKSVKIDKNYDIKRCLFGEPVWWLNHLKNSTAHNIFIKKHFGSKSFKTKRLKIKKYFWNKVDRYV